MSEGDDRPFGTEPGRRRRGSRLAPVRGRGASHDAGASRDVGRLVTGRLGPPQGAVPPADGGGGAPAPPPEMRTSGWSTDLGEIARDLFIYDPVRRTAGGFRHPPIGIRWTSRYVIPFILVLIVLSPLLVTVVTVQTVLGVAERVWKSWSEYREERRHGR